MDILYFIWCDKEDDDQVVAIKEKYIEKYYEEFDLMVFLN